MDAAEFQKLFDWAVGEPRAGLYGLTQAQARWVVDVVDNARRVMGTGFNPERQLCQLLGQIKGT